MGGRQDPLKGNEAVARLDPGRRITAAAEKYNEPGRFTAFIGFEWTSTSGGNNLHRNVIFRDGKDKADQIIPLSQYDTIDPEDLWKWMADYEREDRRQGARDPARRQHLQRTDVRRRRRSRRKSRSTATMPQRRMRWEPLYEVTQIKGDGETHPVAVADRRVRQLRDAGTRAASDTGAKTPEMLPREYARAGAASAGSSYEQKLGVNPFKFGVVGCDRRAYRRCATVEEDNFFGKIATALEPSAEPDRFYEIIAGRFPHRTARTSAVAWESSASGLAAVWATENTREALWDAMARKETYATTGTRAPGARVRRF